MPDEAIDVEHLTGAVTSFGEAVAPSDEPEDWPGEFGEEEVDPAESPSADDEEDVEELREEWGADFDANLALAQEAAHAVADDELVDLLEDSGLGNDPRIIRAAARIGRLLRSGRDHIETAGDADGRDALEETLDELSRRPDYWTDRVQRRVRQIHLALHGDHPVAAYRTTGDDG